MPKLTFTKTGRTYDVPAGTSFLQFCEEHEAPHDFGCTRGRCGTCACVLTAGAENVNPITAEERATLANTTQVPGARLGCQLRILGDVTVKQL